MAVCTSVRVDHLDFTNIVSAGPDIGHSVYDAARNKIYFVYAEQQNSGEANRSLPHGVYFREYDPVAGTFLTAEIIEEVTHPSYVERPEIVRLDSGTLVIVYNVWTGANQVLRSQESTDNGANWGSSHDISTTAAVRTPNSTCTDGTNVYTFQYQGGSGSGTPGGREMFCYLRTGIATWNASVLMYDGAGSNSFEMFRNEIGADMHAVAWVGDDGTTRNVVWVGFRNNGVNTGRTVCLRSTNAGSSWSEVLIKNYADTTTHFDGIGMVHRGTDGRLRCIWNDYQDPPNAVTYLTMAYSDDDGATWTVVGTPTLWNTLNDTSTLKGWAERKNGFALGPDNSIYLCVLYGSGATWVFTVLHGADSLSGWEVFHTCEYTGSADTVRSDCFFANDRLYYVFNESTNPGGGGSVYNDVRFLVEDVPPDEGGGGPPLLEESPTGSDLSNIYIRNEVHTGRGYSAHHPGIRCWSPWGEGDYTTQRRKHILLGGVTTIDPTVGDVANIVAIYKMDDPAHYGIETFITDGSVTIPRIDPLRARWRSKGYPLYKGGMGLGLLRGFMFRYRRVSETFDVVVLVDGKTSFHHTCDPSDASMDELMETFISATTEDNDGTTVQLEIDDQTLFPLIIEAIEPVRIEKGRRGY